MSKALGGGHGPLLLAWPPRSPLKTVNTHLFLKLLQVYVLCVDLCPPTPPPPQWHFTICSIFFLAEQCGKEFWFPISSHLPLCFLMGSPAFTSFCWQSNQGLFPARMGRFPCVCQPPKKLGVYYNLDPSGKTIRNQQALE